MPLHEQTTLKTKAIKDRLHTKGECSIRRFNKSPGLCKLSHGNYRQTRTQIGVHLFLYNKHVNTKRAFSQELILVSSLSCQTLNLLQNYIPKQVGIRHFRELPNFQLEFFFPKKPLINSFPSMVVDKSAPRPTQFAQLLIDAHH